MNDRTSKESDNICREKSNNKLDSAVQRCIPYISLISILVLITYLMLARDIFGIDALLRKNSHFLASRFLSFFYEQNTIAGQKLESSLIVLFDDEYLRCGLGGGLECDEKNGHGRSWPAPFADHAAVLRTILKEQPKVIFYDIIFRPRGDDNPKQNNKSNDNVFIGYLNSAKIPIIMGYLEGKKYEPIYNRIGNQNYAAIGWSGYGDFIPHYSIYDRQKLEDANPQDLHSAYRQYLEMPKDTPPPLLPTVAFRLYQEYSGPEEFESSFNNPLFIYWGVRLKKKPPPFQSIQESIESTLSTPIHPFLARTEPIILPAIKSFLNVIQYTDLTYSKVKLAFAHIFNTEILFNRKGNYSQYADTFNSIKSIGVRDLINLNKEDRKKLIGDKAVFIGTDIKGLPDKVTSPIEGILPGVYYHAMGFDNLVRLGSSYKTDGEAGEIFGLSWADQLENIAFIIISLLYWLGDFIENRFWPRKPLDNGPVASSALFGYDPVIAGKRLGFYTLLAFLSYMFLGWCIYYSWFCKNWDSGNLLGLLSISIPFYFFMRSFIELLVSLIYLPIRTVVGSHPQEKG